MKFQFVAAEFTFLALEVGDLAADEPVAAGGDCEVFDERGHFVARGFLCAGEDFEGDGEQGVAGEHGHAFAEDLVRGRPAAAQIVIIHAGQIVVDEGVSVDAFHGAGVRQSSSGATPYMVVRMSARHGLNLFGVLVGQSSKGRKGTSWNQIASVFERVDEDWKTQRVMGGLSSGEGLIWGVRDAAVTATRHDEDKPGETFQATTLDAGVADKRLMIVEGEFAAAYAEGHGARRRAPSRTVIRAAWGNA